MEDQGEQAVLARANNDSNVERLASRESLVIVTVDDGIPELHSS